MENSGIQKRLAIISLLSVFEGIIAIISLLIIPSESKNQFFLGYSLERWALVGSIFLPLLAMILISIFIIKSEYWAGVAHKLLISSWTMMLLVLALCLFIGIIVILKDNSSLLFRLYPLLFWGSLVSFQIIVYQLITYTEKPDNTIINIFVERDFTLWLTIIFAAPMLFSSAILNKLPLGFAGLYTQMSEQIANSNFHLPLQTPYYGPGGIPFAYPPLGFYLMAIFLKLGGSAWVYLRFAPPVFSLLALIPLFLLTRRISKSNWGGFTAALLAALSYYLYYQHTESGGIVRGLAFGFGLLALYFFDRMIESCRWRDATLAGIFFGLTVLTHLGYAFYFALWMWVWVITNPKWRNWLMAGAVGVMSIVVISPWLVVMLTRYGTSIFVNALLSHGNVSFLSLIQHPSSFFPTLRYNLQSIIGSPLLLILVMAGLLCLIIKKKFTLSVLLLLVAIIFPDGNRFISTVSFIIVGYLVASIYSLLKSTHSIKNIPVEKLIFFVLFIGVFTPFYTKSLSILANQHPLINQEMIDVGIFMRERTRSDAIYVELFQNDDDAEWLPYLTQREPVLSQWGSEWLGTYEIQTTQGQALGRCQEQQDLVCMENQFISIGRRPDYIIIDNRIDLQQLSAQLLENSLWDEVFVNSKYQVWRHK